MKQLDINDGDIFYGFRKTELHFDGSVKYSGPSDILTKLAEYKCIGSETVYFDCFDHQEPARKITFCTSDVTFVKYLYRYCEHDKGDDLKFVLSDTPHAGQTTYIFRNRKHAEEARRAVLLEYREKIREEVARITNLEAVFSEC